MEMTNCGGIYKMELKAYVSIPRILITEILKIKMENSQIK